GAGVLEHKVALAIGSSQGGPTSRRLEDDGRIRQRLTFHEDLASHSGNAWSTASGAPDTQGEQGKPQRGHPIMMTVLHCENFLLIGSTDRDIRRTRMHERN